MIIQNKKYLKVLIELYYTVLRYASVTQLVEYQTFNLRVMGSNPVGRTQDADSQGVEIGFSRQKV